jgi:hypothetical protein
MGDAGGIGDAAGIDERAGGIRVGDGVGIDGAAMVGLLAIAVELNVTSIHEFRFR